MESRLGERGKHVTGRPKKGNPFAVVQEKDDKASEGKAQILESFSNRTSRRWWVMVSMECKQMHG